MAKSASPKSASKKPVVPKLKIFVASTVYNFEDQLSQVCGVLSGFGYEVWNSHLGTIPANPGLSNRESCLAAVDECDLFLGIIRPVYGSGVVNGRSITHDECLRAIELSKPRWFMVHHNVALARQLAAIGQRPLYPFGAAATAVVNIGLVAGRVVACVRRQHGVVLLSVCDGRARRQYSRLYDFCTVAPARLYVADFAVV